MMRMMIFESFQASELHFETDRWYEGLAMYVFDECSNQPKYYRAFAFNQNGNTPHEQWMVDQMASSLGGMLNVCPSERRGIK